jgi:hypothetical protein
MMGGYKEVMGIDLLGSGSLFFYPIKTKSNYDVIRVSPLFGVMCLVIGLMGQIPIIASEYGVCVILTLEFLVARQNKKYKKKKGKEMGGGEIYKDDDTAE